MSVQNVNINQAYQPNYQAPTNTPSQVEVKPRKSNKKAIILTCTGLGIIGLATFLILRKGKPTNNKDPLFGIGNFPRKFMDESIFRKGIEDAQKPESEVIMSISQDQNTISLINTKKQFVCQMFKQTQPDQAKFYLETSQMKIYVFNKDADTAKVLFNTVGSNSNANIQLSVDVDAWLGKVKNNELTYNNNTYKLSDDECTDIINRLEPTRLLYEHNLRNDYIDDLMKILKKVITSH